MTNIINGQNNVIRKNVSRLLLLKVVQLIGVEQVSGTRHLNMSQVVRMETRTLHPNKMQYICKNELSDVMH